MTNEQANKLKEIVYRILEEGDFSEQDVSSLNIQTDYQDFVLKVERPVFYDADKGETAVMPYTFALLLSCTIQNKYLKAMQLNMDQNYINSQLSDIKDVFSNPEKHKELMLKARAEIDDIMSGLRPEMTKADIVTYFNEQLMSRYSYDRSKKKYGYSGACFMYGKCQCSGYTDSMIFLLRKAGFSEDELFTGGDNRKGREHVWNVIKLNNNLYNVDTTWGRHNKETPVKFSHVYLLQSDDVFIHEKRDTPHVIDEHAPEKHLSAVNWTNVDISCTDETYKNAFFTKLKRSQEIIHFYNGYWYVAQDNSIYKAKLEDTDMVKVFEENKAISLKGITVDGVATLKVDGVQKTVNLNESKTAGDTPSPTEDTPIPVEDEFEESEFDSVFIPFTKDLIVVTADNNETFYNIKSLNIQNKNITLSTEKGYDQSIYVNDITTADLAEEGLIPYRWVEYPDHIAVISQKHYHNNTTNKDYYHFGSVNCGFINAILTQDIINSNLKIKRGHFHFSFAGKNSYSQNSIHYFASMSDGVRRVRIGANTKGQLIINNIPVTEEKYFQDTLNSIYEIDVVFTGLIYKVICKGIEYSGICETLTSHTKHLTYLGWSHFENSRDGFYLNDLIMEYDLLPDAPHDQVSNVYQYGLDEEISDKLLTIDKAVITRKAYNYDVEVTFRNISNSDLEWNYTPEIACLGEWDDCRGGAIKAKDPTSLLHPNETITFTTTLSISQAQLTATILLRLKDNNSIINTKAPIFKDKKGENRFLLFKENLS